MEDLEFIKGISKLKISKACKYFGYNQANLISGRCGREAEAKVRKYLEYQLAKIRLRENKLSDNNE